MLAIQNAIPLSPNEEHAVREVNRRIWHNEQLSNREIRTSSRALDLLEKWGGDGVPFEELEKLYANEDNPTQMVNNLIDALNAEFATLERDQFRPQFAIQVFNSEQNSTEQKTAELVVINTENQR
jgi:hypothetical protein